MILAGTVPAVTGGEAPEPAQSDSASHSLKSTVPAVRYEHVIDTAPLALCRIRFTHTCEGFVRLFRGPLSNLVTAP